jgi:multidrug efflux pump subunit AcrA (membrane-fusion protein)
VRSLLLGPVTHAAGLSERIMASPMLSSPRPMSPLRAAGALPLLGSLLLGGAESSFLAACREPDSSAAPGSAPAAAPSVGVIRVQPETLPVSSEWVATLDGFVNAQIRPQVTGYLVRKTYDEGSRVRKDQVLFEIDSRPFRTASAQAEAALARAQADLGRAERDKARDTPLAKERAIPQSQLDNDV